MVVIIDNYDSFTYNIAQYLGELGSEVQVVRNDQASPEEIAAWEPQALVISPGPGKPETAGISNEAIRYFAGDIPILGICLGHQCIGQVFGSRVRRAPYPVHGKTCLVFHEGTEIFLGLASPLTVVRYHSLVVETWGASQEVPLSVTAWTKEGLIMGLRHRDFPIWGLQFHPESVLTEGGKEIIRNFMQAADLMLCPCK